MLRFTSTAVCVGFVLCLSAHAAPAQARTIPPIALSEDAECWYGELYGITGIICRDDGKLYRCTVARTECWFAIPPGPYTRGNGFNPLSDIAVSPTATRTRR
ncbi:hypothetical protein [Terricaulis silvestris]|uniref:Integral membrane protein n=1 Tax=Terricaulis silvestris TaxID=2686094 RepID=A0A6I6MVP6_9CAUL|nr:hypothetical protein [Terricaulis silvestris]QGZ96837.1 hypothetical protein DSM104635_03700 [Terricaulis silvestris]